MGKIKKLLTLEDLVKFCKEQNFSKFSSKASGYQLSVQIPATFEIEKEEYQDNTLLFGKVKVFHIGPNRNGSSVTKEAAQKALNTIAYKPLLANFCEIDGVKDFTSHDMELNEDGTITYLERQIGCFTADSPVIQYDETTEKEFVFAKVAIPREYTDACSIIEAKNGTKVSAELIINEMNYSAKDDILELTDVIFQGATCLGRNPETGEAVEEGMQGARLDIVDFSKDNNSVAAEVDTDINNKLFEILEKLNTTISNFSIKKNYNQEGVNEEMDKLNELLEAYELTLDELNFDVEGLSDEDLEAKFTEAFGDAEEFKKKKRCSEDEESEEEDDDFAKCGTKKKKCDAEDESEEDDEESEEDFAGCGKKKRRCSLNTEEGTVQFELSHDDIRMNLYGLLNDNEEDSYYWICEVYDDYFIYQKETYTEDGYETKYYKQGYSKTEDSVELSGDAEEVFPTFVTESERTALDMIRSQYEELKKFHDETIAAQEKAQKDEIFNDEKYSILDGNEKFAQLKKDSAKFNLSEIEEKCKVIFAEEIMAKGNYSAGEKKSGGKLSFNLKVDTKKKAYGKLFD